MLTEQEVIQIAENYVIERSQKSGLNLIILEDRCIKKPYGMIFRYNTKKYNETRNDDDNTLLGNAPFIVENSNGKIILFGTGREIEYYIKEYEAGRWPDMPRLSDFQ
ncbi:hypothetical protein NZ698_10955 [Chryseobacterium sp. PBS4-4]|uniref:Immunity protein 35 domain-containing protein n=1 Tax=Chryseobacterium edaphi TaxID=2976532 RepID=A0ABT2W8Y5_9FLAO|nr:hypothetical protein [Chryseobacterium edaphi]MCU7617717.1 hypothetical protein [Chryseobacterium edaphi]